VSTALLTVAEMQAADRLAVKSGVASLKLMENAGRAVASFVSSRYPKASVTVLCGPGNNGGDGFVAARLLKGRKYKVRVLLLGKRTALKGDAAAMAKKWKGEVQPLSLDALSKADVIVDALFGAGLTRPLEGAARALAEGVKRSGVPVVAVDVPSGLSGDLGRPLGEGAGAAIRASHTVTFFRKKPGHVLLPGRNMCGETHVASIGIPEAVLDEILPSAFENHPSLWRSRYPIPSADGHKYARGHAVVVSGPPHATGAARLAARGALRIGAGLVSVASPLASIVINAAHLTAVIVKPFDGSEGLRKLLNDKRLNAVVIGPGLGLDDEARALVECVLGSGTPVVLDADALTLFAGNAGALLALLHPHCVLTPHDGEFERLFPDLRKNAGSKLEAARQAARDAGCIVVLKGADTVIAAPDGRAVINANAPPTLATAGAGDVLAGFIAGLLAQKMDVFSAACAAVWLHGEAAQMFGPGLIAEDLPEMLPAILRDLLAPL